MGLESATYISDLVDTNPASSDAKSQGDDHIRLLKSTIQATFPNVSGAVTPTHVELNFVDGVTSAIQTQLDAKGAVAGQTWSGAHDYTGGTLTVATQGINDDSTRAASTAWVLDYLGDAPVASTPSVGDNSTRIATTAFAVQLAFQAALPAQSGNGGKFLTTDGSSASWTNNSPDLPLMALGIV